MPDDLDSPDDEQQPEDNAVMRELRKKADRTSAAESEAQAAKRELTLHKAGLGTLSDKQMKALMNVHEGDWEPDLLKATATELGFTQPTAPSQEQIPQGELEAHQRVAAAAGGAPPPPIDLDAALLAAKSPAEIHQLLVNANMLNEQ